MSDNKFVKMSSKELREKYDKPLERIRHMSNMQVLVRVLAMGAFMVAVSATIYTTLFGMPIMGVPSKSSIVQVEVSSPRLTDESVIVTDEEYIEYARNIVSYVNKSLFKDIEGESGEPIVTIKYTDKKGNVTEVAANEDVLFFKDKTYPIQQKGMFVTIAEGLFFPELADISSLVPQQ